MRFPPQSPVVTDRRLIQLVCEISHAGRSFEASPDDYDQVAESRGVRRVKVGIRSFAGLSMAYGCVGQIQMGNPRLFVPTSSWTGGRGASASGGAGRAGPQSLSTQDRRRLRLFTDAGGS